MKKLLLVLFGLQSLSIAQSSTVFTNIKRANRRANAQTIRNLATQVDSKQKLALQPTNGDQELYLDKRGNYGKGLVQDATGLVNTVAYNSLVQAATSWLPADFNTIMLALNPPQRRLQSPQAGLDFSIFGADPAIFSMIAPPTLASAEKAGEMVELYWMALTRDVPFVNYSTDSTIASAIADLNNLSDFTGPKIDGVVTAQTIFRIDLPGVLTGPYISQFLVQPVPISNTTFIQQYVSPIGDYSGNDFMTTVTEWSFIQQGNNPLRSLTFGPAAYINDGRDLGNFVHNDPPQLDYLYAMCIILGYGATVFDQNNPYISNPTQEAFADFFKPQFAALMCYSVDVALRAAWYQKWIVHRTIRPEFYAFLVNQQITGIFDYGLNSDVINSQAVQAIFTHNMALNGPGVGTYLLPQAFPEGCPLHPAYPAGHATVAGACVTMLKAFFNEEFIIPNPLVADAMGNLQSVSESLTLGGELNKLAANISLGRNMAGVHYRSDAVQALLLGEQVAISILNDWANTPNIPFIGFSLTKFDGTKITIGANETNGKKNVSLLP